MGLITTLIGNFAQSRAQEQLQRAQDVQNQIRDYQVLMSLPDINPQKRQEYAQKIQDLAEKHGGPEARKHSSTIGTILSTLAGTLGEMGGVPRKQRQFQPATATSGGPIFMTPEQEEEEAMRRARLTARTADVTQQVTDARTLTSTLTKEEAERQRYIADQQRLAREGKQTQQETDENIIAYYRIGKPPTEGGAAKAYKVPVDQKTGRQLPEVLVDKAGNAYDPNTGARITIPEGYVLQSPGTVRAETGPVGNIEKAFAKLYDPNTPAEEKQTLRDWLAKNTGPSGRPGQIYWSLKQEYPNADDQQIRQMAGERFFQETGVRLNNTILNMEINSELSGLPVPQTFGVPQPGAPGRSGAPAPTRTPAATPGRPGTVATQPAPGQPTALPPLTGGDRRLVDNFMANVAQTGSTAGGGRGAGALGIQKGRDTVVKRLEALGLPSDPVSLLNDVKTFQADMKSMSDIEQTANAYNAVNRRIEGFAANFEQLARKVNNISGRWLNTPWREIKQGVIGDPDIDQYLLSLNALDRIYTTLTASPESKAQLPEGARTHIESLLPPGLRLKEALSIAPQLHAEAEADIQGFSKAVQDIQHKTNTNPIGQALGAPQNGAGAAGGGRATGTPKRGDKQSYQGATYVFDGTQWVRQ